MKRFLKAVVVASVAVAAVITAGVAADPKPGTSPKAYGMQDVGGTTASPTLPPTTPPPSAPSATPTSTGYEPPPVETDVLAWCSPGFWRNAAPAAWTLTGYTKDTVFNGTVASAWYGANLGVGVTLGDVLASPQTYSGKAVPGSLGYSLNAYNAVGALLTSALDGYRFDGTQTTSCPVNNHGVLVG